MFNPYLIKLSLKLSVTHDMVADVLDIPFTVTWVMVIVGIVGCMYIVVVVVVVLLVVDVVGCSIDVVEDVVELVVDVVLEVDEVVVELVVVVVVGGAVPHPYVHPVVPSSFHPSGVLQVLLSPELESQFEELKSVFMFPHTMFEFIVRFEDQEEDIP